MITTGTIRYVLRLTTLAAAIAVLLYTSTSHARAQVAAGDYRIQGGDQLSISVAQDQTQTQTTTVLDDGTVVLPLTGRVKIGGMTPDQASHVLAQRMKTYMRNPDVTVSVVKEGDLNVIVR